MKCGECLFRAVDREDYDACFVTQRLVELEDTCTANPEDFRRVREALAEVDPVTRAVERVMAELGDWYENRSDSRQPTQIAYQEAIKAGWKGSEDG